MKLRFYSMLLLLAFFMVNCGIAHKIAIQSAISNYRNNKSSVHVGDKKDKVLAILVPTQKSLPSDASKESESFKDHKGRLVEIYYFRSGIQPDGLTTDDEFTPYLFINNRLRAIGWSAIGGIKSQGQTRTKITIIN